MSIQSRTKEEIYRYFQDCGCTLLEDYRTATYKMKYICKCGRESKISWNKFLGGRRCGFCDPTGRKKKYSLEEVKVFFSERGCVLLAESYDNNRSPLLYRCVCNNVAKICLTAFLYQNQLCMKCGAKARTGKNNHMWMEDREKLKLNYNFRQRCRRILQRTLKITNQKKYATTNKSLGYSSKQLMEHITSFANWGLISQDVWHIDHIFPIKAFCDFGIKDIKIINCLDNLRPISKKENQLKNDTYNKEEFKNWLAKKIVL